MLNGWLCSEAAPAEETKTEEASTEQPKETEETPTAPEGTDSCIKAGDP